MSISNVLKNILQIEEVEIVELDFRDINFISRSATHQLITVANTLQNRGSNITFSNLESTVETLIQKVSESMKKIIKEQLL